MQPEQKAIKLPSWIFNMRKPIDIKTLFKKAATLQRSRLGHRPSRTTRKAMLLVHK